MKDTSLGLLEFLSFNPQRQIEYIKRKNIGKCAVGFHTIALDFCGFTLQSRTAYDGRITLKQLREIEKLDALFQKMNPQENSFLWTHEGMINSLEWKNVRKQAKKILSLFHELSW